MAAVNQMRSQARPSANSPLQLMPIFRQVSIISENEQNESVFQFADGLAGLWKVPKAKAGLRRH